MATFPIHIHYHLPPSVSPCSNVFNAVNLPVVEAPKNRSFAQIINQMTEEGETTTPMRVYISAKNHFRQDEEIHSSICMVNTQRPLYNYSNENPLCVCLLSPLVNSKDRKYNEEHTVNAPIRFSYEDSTQAIFRGCILSSF